MSGLRKVSGASSAHRHRRDGGLRDLPRPEWLVGIGYRCWIAGYATGDIQCWEHCWNTYARELGPARAKPIISELSCWVRALGARACRPLDYYPYGCARLCRDEYLAISLISACQHSTCPGARACAYHLTEAVEIDPVVDASHGFAAALRAADEILTPKAAATEGAFMPPWAGRAH